jgi:hypothetical protein
VILGIYAMREKPQTSFNYDAEVQQFVQLSIAALGGKPILKSLLPLSSYRLA